MNTQPAAGDVTPDYARIIQKMGSLDSISTKVNQIATQNSQASQNIIKQIISIREKIETIKALWNEKLKEIDGLQSQHASSIDELRNSHATALANATNQGSASSTELDALKRAILEADQNYTDQSTSLMTSLENTLMNGDILKQMNQLYNEVNALSLAVGSAQMHDMPPLRSGTGATGAIGANQGANQGATPLANTTEAPGADISGTPGEDKSGATLGATDKSDDELTLEGLYNRYDKKLGTNKNQYLIFIKYMENNPGMFNEEETENLRALISSNDSASTKFINFYNTIFNPWKERNNRQDVKIRDLKGGSRKKRRRSSKKRHHITRRKHHSKKKHGGRKSLKKHKKDHKKKRPMKRVTFKKHH